MTRREEVLGESLGQIDKLCKKKDNRQNKNTEMKKKVGLYET